MVPNAAAIVDMMKNDPKRDLWTDEEIKQFRIGIELFGKDAGKLSEHIGTKNRR